MDQPEYQNYPKGAIHRVLAHSYLFSFLVFLFALFLDFLFPLKLFENSFAMIPGFLMLALGSALIFWAQKSSRGMSKENITRETFLNGPYRYTRSPTCYGIFLLTFGLGFMMNSLFIALFSVISLVVTKYTFIGKEEKILSEKYGSPYLEYKKSVKF